MSGDFGLSAALGDDGMAELIRRQRDTARRYGEHEVVARQTAWLVENGHETAGADDPGDWDPVDRILLDDPDEARAFALREVSGRRDEDAS